MTAALRNRVTVITLAVIIVLMALATHLITVDHYGSAYFGTVYGISVGTDAHYCSVETAWPALTCESAS